MQRRWDMHAVIHQEDDTYVVKKLTIGVGDTGIVMTGTEAECNARLNSILYGEREFYLVSRANLEKMETTREIVTAPRGSNYCFPDAIFVKRFLDRQEAYEYKKSLRYIEELLKMQTRRWAGEESSAI